MGIVPNQLVSPSGCVLFACVFAVCVCVPVCACVCMYSRVVPVAIQMAYYINRDPGKVWM